jgi:enoyl-CoA hydratase
MIELSEKDGITTLRMVRGKGNALDLEFLGALIDALDTIERSAARAVIITGQGSAFGAGVDLTALVGGGAEYVRRFLPRLSQLFERLVTFPKPIVAAVNGHAIAGGAIIVLACDQRIAARGTARIGLSEVQVGVPFPGWPLEIARFTTAPEHFHTIVCTGRTWPPEEAVVRGLVDEVVDADRLLQRAAEVAGEMAAVAPGVFAAMKRDSRRPLVEAARRQAALGDAAVVDYWCSIAARRSIEGFIARTIKRR